MIPDDVIEQVREHADIVAIVGELVKLKRSGNSYRGPCPFHQGKDPNFAVSPRGGYVCFVCHEKGDVFTFVQKRLGMDFVDAVKYVGAKSGVEVKEVSRDRENAVDPRQRFWEMNAAAAEFFAKSLWEAESGAPAREYLGTRSLARDVAERFGLGFAPSDTKLLREHLSALGYDTPQQVDAGLLVVRTEQDEPRSRFRNRLMFPIYDPQSRVIAFGGRVIGEGEPKYLNSAESPTFQKGSTLYGLNWAKHAIRREGRALLVEGYFDCVRLLSAGVESTVAPLGTSLTDAQADLIRRYTSTAFLLYDSDRAGLKATFRAADVLLRKGTKVLVVTLPDGEDPDTFVRTRGPNELGAELDHAIDIFERKIQILQRGGWFSDLRRKRIALDRLLPTIRAASDPITRGLYLARAAEAIGVGQDVLERELRQGSGTGRAIQAPTPRTPPDRRSDIPDRRVTSGRLSPERELVRLLLHRRQHVEAVAEHVGPENFREAWLARIFARLVENPDESFESLSNALDDDSGPHFSALVENKGGLEEPGKIIKDSIAAFRQREIGEKMQELDRQLPLADPNAKDAIAVEKNRLLDELQTLGVPRHWKQFRRPNPQP